MRPKQAGSRHCYVFYTRIKYWTVVSSGRCAAKRVDNGSRAEIRVEQQPITQWMLVLIYVFLPSGPFIFNVIPHGFFINSEKKTVEI